MSAGGFAERLLRWYDTNKRSFVFRGTRDPYHVWLSEIMLQQTRTESVTPYYERFLRQFPDVHALAQADEEAVLRCWQGLGYYSRARNLHRAARQVEAELGGMFPRSAEALMKLPGIGAYTAAAVASIAFGECVPAMDGNLIRVFARYTDETADASAPETRSRLSATARQLMPPGRPGDFNQALMDLGATVCTPGTPDCDACPVRDDCRGRLMGTQTLRPLLPHKAPPKPVALNVLMIFWDGRVYMRMRTEALLKGMYVYALSEEAPEQALRRWQPEPPQAEYVGEAQHVFTHRVWHMRLWSVHMQSPPAALQPHFYTLAQLEALPIPVAMRAANEYVRKELKHESQNA